MSRYLKILLAIIVTTTVASGCYFLYLVNSSPSSHAGSQGKKQNAGAATETQSASSRENTQAEKKKEPTLADVLTSLNDPTLDERQRTQLEFQLAKLYAIEAPDDGIAWLNSLEPRKMQNCAGAFGAQIGLQDFENWQTYYDRLNPTARGEFTKGVFWSYATIDLKASWETFEKTCEQKPELKWARVSLVRNFAYRRADDFWPLLVNRVNELPNDKDANSLLGIFFTAARFTNSNNTLKAIVSITDENTRYQCAKLYMGRTDIQRSGAIPQLMRSLAASPESPQFKDQMLGLAIESYYFKDLVEATEFSKMITDPALREQYQKTILEHAAKKSPEAERAVQDKLLK